MCYKWYTNFVIIRTRRESFKRDALIAFHVIGNDLQVIIIKVNGIDKGFDDMPAEVNIRSVALAVLAVALASAVDTDKKEILDRLILEHLI